MDSETFEITKPEVNNTVISVEEARLILQDDQMTDKDVQETINSLQLLVELIYDNKSLEEAEQLQEVMDEIGLDAENALEIAQDI